MRGRYTPQLSEENIRRLYNLKQQCGCSMVRLLNEIVSAYFAARHDETAPADDQRKDLT
jgi:hypothetical protein